MKIDIKKLREIEGITPEDIANTLNISQTYTSMLLNGKRKMSKEKWDVLKSKYCNITKYVIEESNITKEPEKSNITDSDKDITSEYCQYKDMIPAYILKICNEERMKYNEQISRLIEQNSNLMRQNEKLIDKIPDYDEQKKTAAQKEGNAGCADAS